LGLAHAMVAILPAETARPPKIPDFINLLRLLMAIILKKVRKLCPPIAYHRSKHFKFS
jgi:hypothetical protein